ncbi:diguanylate cyclase [Thiohalorhabdus methylotrophus]|uniref:Diguanylate cyclase n=1 Tax=Thiohalorhabdus methylotrophus TaxID=3242694 RepID=A0ABV4TR95_9GAMM
MTPHVRARKGAIGLWVAVFIGILVLVGAELTTSYFQAVAQSTRHARNLAHLLSERLSGTLHEADLVLRGLEMRLEPAQLGGGTLPEAQKTRLRGLLRQQVEFLAFAHSMTLYGPEGGVRLRAGATDEALPLADPAGFVQAGDTGAGMLRDASRGMEVVLVRRIRAPDGRVVAFADCRIRPAYFRRKLAELGLDGSQSVAILDEALHLVARRPPAAEQRGAALRSAPLDTRLSRGEVTGQLRATLPVNGKPRNYAFRKVEGYPFLVLVGASPMELLGPWGLKIATYLGGTALLVTLLLLLMRGQLRNLRLAREVQTRLVALEAADDMVMITGPDGTIEYVNPSFEQTTGYSEREVRGRYPSFLKSPEQDEAVYEELWRRIRAGKSWKGELVNRRKDGRPFTGEQTIAPVKDEGGAIIRFVAVMRDITERKHMERQLEHRATHDPLTGAYNRLKFQELLEQEREKAERYGRSFSVILLDIDHFKRVNDVHGHPVGDLVLEGVTGVLEERLRASDVLARWGGEEFIVLLPETALPNARKVAEDLRISLEAASMPEAPPVTASFGVAELKGGEAGQELLRRVDSALYRAKEAGRNRVREAPGQSPS